MSGEGYHGSDVPLPLLLAILQQANAASPSVWPMEWIADHCPEFRDEAGRQSM
jgi:hypothetical protein